MNIEERFSKLISDKGMSLLDNPFLVEKFFDMKEHISWSILDEAINNDLAWWELIEKTGKKMDIPYTVPYWLAPMPQQNKSFIIDHVKRGYTFIIFKSFVLNEKLKSLMTIIQHCFNVAADIHIYGSKGKSGGLSFTPHADNPANFIIQVEGETEWVVFKNRVSDLLKVEYVLQEDDILKLDPVIETRLKPGDLLYIPSRHYHCAMPKSPRMSISIPCIPLNPTMIPADTSIYKI